jgi:inosine/xanthosine triphosphatase
MDKIYVGTTNKVKLSAIREVFKDYEIVGLEVQSGVSSQPKSDEEAIKGARNRAIALPRNGLRIGLEAGIHPYGSVWMLMNWGVLIDQEEREYLAGGIRIPLPREISTILVETNRELADVIDEYVGKSDIRSKEGAMGIFTNNVVVRKDIFVQIAQMLLGQYQRQKEGQK